MRLKLQIMKKLFPPLFHGLKTYRKVSRRTQTWQPLCFSWLILDSLQSISYKVAKMGHEKQKSCQVWVRLGTFLYVLKPWNTYEKVSSLSELSNAPTLMLIWKLEVTLKHFWFILQNKPKSGNNRSHPLIEFFVSLKNFKI